MTKRPLYLGLFLFSILGTALSSLTTKDTQASSLTGKTLVLYDAASGDIPSESLMDFVDFPPGAASLAYSDDTAVLDTSLSGSEAYAGWVSGQAITPAFPILDGTAGFQVNFTLQVESERHTSKNRAGFSLIVLDQNARGIELSFWENEVWVQNDDRTGGLFTHGEGASFATTPGLTDYQVTIIEDTYTLTANSVPLLSGPVRDYGSFAGLPDPYETPNFLFLGDDTSSSQARVRLRSVSVTGTEPVMPTVTNTSPGTGIPLPTVTLIPPHGPSPVPLPTPAPTARILELCSSGWLFLVITIPHFLFIRKNRRKYRDHFDV